MFRSLRPHALLLALAIAGGASGQTFQGLDSPQQPKKKAAKKSSSSSKSAASKTPTAVEEGDRAHHHLRGARRHRPHRGPAAARGGQRVLQSRRVRQGGARRLGADERP